jgi:hypothetical protein
MGLFDKFTNGFFSVTHVSEIPNGGAGEVQVLQFLLNNLKVAQREVGQTMQLLYARTHASNKSNRMFLGINELF